MKPAISQNSWVYSLPWNGWHWGWHFFVFLGSGRMFSKTQKQMTSILEKQALASTAGCCHRLPSCHLGASQCEPHIHHWLLACSCRHTLLLVPSGTLTVSWASDIIRWNWNCVQLRSQRQNFSTALPLPGMALVGLFGFTTAWYGGWLDFLAS